MDSQKLHIPVLLEPILSFISEIEGPISYGLDGTFGRGGHSMCLV